MMISLLYRDKLFLQRVHMAHNVLHYEMEVWVDDHGAQG